jgi:mono/diheme cytochrome c family protein
VRRAAAILVLAVLPAASPAAAGGDGRIDYTLHCRGCHGADGAGAAEAVPSFRGQLARFLRAPGGREYLVRVPGTSQSELSDARIAALLNWMLREFSPGEMPADFTPYDEDEIARLRRPPLTDVLTVRHRLVQALEALGDPP